MDLVLRHMVLRFLTLGFVIVLAVGGAMAGAATGSRDISVEDLISGEILGVPPGSLLEIGDGEVLAVSDEMRTFLDEMVDRRASDYIKLQQLVYAIINEGTFGLEYDEKTRTASETFRQRQGNCLAFSNMFVAMARDVGLEVKFQEVDIPPDWSYKNDSFVLNRHVNVSVDLGKAGYHAVDFNIDDFRTGYDRRTVSDRRAFAHYFNNLGVERLQAGDSSEAFLFFREAIEYSDRGFAPAWTNLAILYSRAGYPSYAEVAYLQALRANPGDDVAMSNLANFYEDGNEKERAAAYRKKVTRHRRQNPYYRYQLARDAFFARDYETAIGHLKFANRKREDEDQFMFLLGMSYLMSGNEEAARRWLTRAEEAAATDALKRNYSTKIDMLLSESERAVESE